MKSKLPWIVLGVAAYLAFLLVTFPAATAIRWFAPDQFRATGVSGTLWSGRAELASVQGYPLTDLIWDIKGHYLLFGRIAGQIEASIPGGFVNTRLSLSSSSVRLNEVRASTNLPALASIAPMAANIGGSVSMQFESLELKDGVLTELLGTIRVAQLEVEPFNGQGSGRMPVGDYEAVFVANEPARLANIHDLNGPVEITDGRLLLYPDGSYELSGLLRERDNAPPAIVQGLQFMTTIGMADRPDGELRRAFSMQGSL